MWRKAVRSLNTEKSNSVLGKLGLLLGVILLLPVMLILLWLNRGREREDRVTEKKILQQFRDMQRSQSSDGRESGA